MQAGGHQAMVPDQMAYDQHGQPLIVSNKHGTFAQWPPLGYNVIVILPMKLGEFLGESLARMKSVLYFGLRNLLGMMFHISIYFNNSPPQT